MSSYTYRRPFPSSMTLGITQSHSVDVLFLLKNYDSDYLEPQILLFILNELSHN